MGAGLLCGEPGQWWKDSTMKRATLASVMVTLWASRAWACPFCSQDGMLVRSFILAVIGSVLLAFLCFLFWALASGRLDKVEEIKHRMLENDARTTVRIR